VHKHAVILCGSVWTRTHRVLQVKRSVQRDRGGGRGGGRRAQRAHAEPRQRLMLLGERGRRRQRRVRSQQAQLRARSPDYVRGRRPTAL